MSNGGCFHCGARASCRHRTVEEPTRPFAVGPERLRKGQGNLNSPWGKHGNPSGKARDRIMAMLKSQLKVKP